MTTESTGTTAADRRDVSDLGDQLGPPVEAAGMVNLLNHGAASCVYSEGCHGVTQEHLERFAELVRKRKPLTLEQIAALEAGCSHQSVDWDTRVSLVRSVERAHGIGA